MLLGFLQWNDEDCLLLGIHDRIAELFEDWTVNELHDCVSNATWKSLSYKKSGINDGTVC